MMRDEEYEAGLSPEKFREIFNERRAEKREKAKLKRLLDLRRIQDMKSTEGNTAIELLPEEESIILDDLSPQDRRNIWDLDPLFRSLMETTHLQENLFPLILKFLQGYLFRTVTLEEAETEDADNENAEEFLNRPYLQLRRVCKSWKDAVDLVIEEDLLHRLRDDEYIVMNLDIGREPEKCTKFQFFCFQDIPDPDIPRLDRILAFTESNSALLKCFISRSLYIDLPLSFNPGFENLFPAFKDKICRLMRHAGDKILYFVVQISQHHESPDNRLNVLYSTLVEWLKFLPNLKWLQIRFGCAGKRLGNAFDLQLLRNQPPPVLESLERLDLAMVRVAPSQREEMEAISRVFVAACPKITRLNLVCSGVYDALSSLGPETFYLGSSQNNLLDLTPIASTLKCLTLHLDLSPDVHNMSSVFQFLQQFPSLEVLNLEVETVVIDDGIDFLQLPNLKELGMRFKPIFNCDAPFTFFFSLNFLLHSKMLRKLNWSNWLEIEGVRKLLEYWEVPEDDSSSMIDFVDGRRVLTDSNIWQVFPYLEELQTVIIVPFGDGGQNKVYRKHRNGKLIRQSDMIRDKHGNYV